MAIDNIFIGDTIISEFSYFMEQTASEDPFNINNFFTCYTPQDLLRTTWVVLFVFILSV